MRINIKKVLNKLKEKKLFSFMIGFIFLSIFILFTFFYDVGLNSKYFVKKDFSEAFLLRQTGNCEEFVKYLNKDWTNWVSRCYEEKVSKNDSIPIKEFLIKKITINRDRGFLLVEIKRDKDSYMVNYEMIRNKGSWFIDQFAQ